MKKRGSITVETAIILPAYILVLFFLINFLNVYYIHAAVHQGLTNAASMLAQYCYVADISIGMDSLIISSETNDKVKELTDGLEQFNSSAGQAMQAYNEGISISNIENIINHGKTFIDSTKNLTSKLKKFNKEDLTSAVIATTSEGVGGLFVKVIVDNHLKNMKINTSTITDGIKYNVHISTDGNYDLILTAEYNYCDPIFQVITKGFSIKQQVVVHPWIGGKTDGLRGI